MHVSPASHDQPLVAAPAGKIDIGCTTIPFMSRRFYKCATIGMASFIGVLAILYVVVILMPAASVNNQPHTLENVPEEWAFHTWEDGQDEATYDSNTHDCTLNVHKGTSEHHIVVNMSLVCDREDGSTSGVSRAGHIDASHTFVTEPADFDFVYAATKCNLSFWYGSDPYRVGADHADVSYCMQRE